MKAKIWSSIAGGLIPAALINLLSCQKDLQATDGYTYVNVIVAENDGTTTFIDNNLKLVLTPWRKVISTASEAGVEIRGTARELCLVMVMVMEINC